MPSERRFSAEQRATHAPLPSHLGPRWIDGPLMPHWVDKTSGSQTGQDQDYTKDEPLLKTWVSRAFQQCGQQYVDGNCRATTQHLSTVVLGVCFELQASACQVSISQYLALFIVVPLSWKCPSTGPRESQNTIRISFPADDWVLNFFLQDDYGCFHSILCRLLSGS